MLRHADRCRQPGSLCRAPDGAYTARARDEGAGGRGGGLEDAERAGGGDGVGGGVGVGDEGDDEGGQAQHKEAEHQQRQRPQQLEVVRHTDAHVLHVTLCVCGWVGVGGGGLYCLRHHAQPRRGRRLGKDP